MNRVLWLSALLALVGCVEGGTLAPGVGAGGSPSMTATGGISVAGASAAASGPWSCPAPDGKTNAVLHADAAAVLSAMSGTTMTSEGAVGASCGFGSCHGSAGLGKLMLGVTDLSTLRGKPSCEAPAVPIVAPNGGDAALKNSWLWIKLVAPADPMGGLTPDPAWGTGGVAACGELLGKPFGSRMPFMRGADMPLDERRLGMVRRWICAGANPAQ
jgi:hypothetical protein